MRIIAGTFRGRRVDAPPGQGTRPMLDRVREALFSSLGARLDDACVLDLYAGSGSLGIEACSRGARFVRCVESSARVVSVLRANLTTLGIDKESVQIRRGRALDESCWAAPDMLDVAPGTDRAPWADIVLMDPPYPAWRDLRERTALHEAIRKLVEHTLLPDGLLVLHTPRRALTRAEFGKGVSVDERQYGSCSVWYVAPDPESEPEPEPESAPSEELEERS